MSSFKGTQVPVNIDISASTCQNINFDALFRDCKLISWRKTNKTVSDGSFNMASFQNFSL